MSAPRVVVVVIAFNRPRLLRACLASVVAARPDELIVADDGSDFDVAALCARFGALLIANPPLTVDERMVQKRQGRLINDAFAMTSGDVQLLLCDDDVLADGWCDSLRAEWTANPRRELVRGTWLVFEDGQIPSESDPPCPLDGRQMTAGNFAWHASLTRDRGIAWPQDRTSCLDNGFLWSCQAQGVDTFRVPLVGHMAGWRREHIYTGVRYSDGSNHTPAFRDVLARGMLEP